MSSEWCTTSKLPPNWGNSFLMVFRQWGHWATTFFTPYPFMSSTLAEACIWKRYSLPSRRAVSPLQVSSSPRMANFTPAARRIFTMARETFFCRSSKAPAQPTKKSHSKSPSLARGTARSSHHSARRFEPMPHGLPWVSMFLKTRAASSGKADSTSTWWRRRSTRRGTCSMSTGQAVSHQPQVVQAQTVDSGSTFPTTAGSFSAAASRAAASGARATASSSGARSWMWWRSVRLTSLWLSGLPVT